MAYTRMCILPGVRNVHCLWEYDEEGDTAKVAGVVYLRCSEDIFRLATLMISDRSRRIPRESSLCRLEDSFINLSCFCNSPLQSSKLQDVCFVLLFSCAPFFSSKFSLPL